MPHVSVHYKIYLPGGHHRQPRNPAAELEPNPSSEIDVAYPGNITPLYIPQIPYTLGGGSGLAELLFWSVTDGTEGRVAPAGSLTQPVGTQPLVITAWYYPISGPGTVGPGIIIDAFSANLGAFIDDTFVSVTSDPSLNDQANVVGVVPTTSAQTLKAYASVVSTTEPFSYWMSFGAGVASGDILQIPVLASGFAVAMYQNRERRPPVRDLDDIAVGGKVIGGVAVDGGGYIIIGGKPRPIDPWGPLIVRLIHDSALAAQARSLDKRFAKEVRRLIAQDIRQALKEFEPVIELEVSGK